ncbi:hypothetical protein [Domibacillus epiphyticus]|uniref:IDEAL domain-containing protein n=1 Tax=Domibacillus epiphyticus TaxID=1714355 RepID=A0A1V2A8I5_9BACI|nr:hypothetical protein [Domibacillus epiphyticus]OMP67303.1 hypothetical protein BTO28_08240 [Domibacillus epiphyticus]
MVRNGDWIRAKIENYYVIGFVENISFERNKVFITKVAEFIGDKTYWVKPTPKLFTVDRVEKLEVELIKDDWDCLIDLAIQTSDEKWFEQLSERMLLDA